jgi:hypothetical protein
MGIYRKYDLTTEAVNDWAEYQLQNAYSIDMYRVVVFDGFEEFHSHYENWEDAKQYLKQIIAGTEDEYWQYCKFSVIGLVFD